MFAVQTGHEDDPIMEQAHQLRLVPLTRTNRRHRRQLLHLRGHLRPYVRQGNKRATVLRGHACFLLAFWRCLHPKTTAAETNAFLWNAHGRFQPTPRLYSPSQITEAEDRLGLSRKRASTTARQALDPRNVLKRQIFWTFPYPFGIADIHIDDYIDLDEAGVFVETATRKWGKCVIGTRCRQAGPYGHSKKTTFAMAIASGPCRSRWRKLSMRPGTDLQFFIDFIQEILNDIGPGTAQRRRCFLMDNLVTHHHPLISQMIITAGHRISYRAPYYPVDGPIEYVFNTIQQELGHRMHFIHDLPSLHAHISAVVASLYDFRQYFLHCGY
jgi:hypothetical protein